MRCTLQILSALLLAAGSTGCASPGYWADRGRDAADVFTLSAGSGTGVRARVGPIGTGLLMDSTGGGWRGGDWLSAQNYVNKGKPVEWNHDIQIGLLGEEDFMGSILGMQRGKAFSSRMICGLNIPMRKTFRKEGAAMAEALRQPSPGPARHAPAAYFTQVEAVVGLGVSLRLGFNPGELLDFLLGFVGLDMYGDDIDTGIEEVEPPPVRELPRSVPGSTPRQPAASSPRTLKIKD